MKKIYLILITIIFTVKFSYAQWVTSGSNIYYNSGNVGIGTTSPTANLTIAGSTIGSVSSTGTVFRANSTAISGLVTGFYSNPAGTATTNIGVWGNSLNGTNNINILTGNNTPPTGNWDVYANSGATNYFSGNAGFGTTIPVAHIQTNITSGSSTAKGVLSTLYGSPLTSGGALYAAYYTGGTETSPVGPTVGSTINSYGFFTGGTAGGIFVNPSFAIQHTITSVSSVLSNVNTSFMINSTASGTPYPALTIQGQVAGQSFGNIGMGNTAPTFPLQVTNTANYQARFEYDATHGLSIGTASNGAITFSSSTIGAFLTANTSNLLSTTQAFQVINPQASNAATFTTNLANSSTTNISATVATNSATYNTTASALTGYGFFKSLFKALIFSCFCVVPIANIGKRCFDF